MSTEADAGTSARDRLRRVGISVVIVAGLGGIALAGAAVREVDRQGDVILQRDDPNEVTITGDADDIALQPPGAASGGPSEADIVEQTIPAEGAQILQQQQIGIDLGNRYRVARLVVGGAVIDEEHLIRRDELSQVFFQPAEGYEFDAFPPGEVCAVAEVEQATTGEPVRSVEWCFEVT